MKTIKKTVLLILAIILCFQLAACTKKAPDNTDEKQQSPTDEFTDNTDNTEPDEEANTTVGIGDNEKDNLVSSKDLASSILLVGEQNKYEEYINYRATLSNTYKKLTTDKQLTVVYFGGSVTDGYGATDNNVYSWRAKIGNWLTKQFPDAEINNVNRAIGESGTYLGAFRVQMDVIAAQPDLLFVEYSINDLYYKSTYEEAASQYETIIREVKAAMPDTDIVTVLVTDKNQLDLNKQGKLHTQAQAHEDIAAAYNIPTLHVGLHLAKVTGYSTSEWSQYAIDGVHLNDTGYDEYFKVIREFMHNSLLFNDYSDTQQGFVMPDIVSEALFDGNRSNIQPTQNMITYSESQGGKGVVYSAQPSIKDSTKSDAIGRFVFDNIEDELVIKFSGTEICAYVFSKSVSWSVSIDGGNYTTVEGTSHNPVIFAKGLNSGEHTIRIKLLRTQSVQIGSLFVRDANTATTKTT